MDDSDDFWDINTTRRLERLPGRVCLDTQNRLNRNFGGDQFGCPLRSTRTRFPENSACSFRIGSASAAGRMQRTRVWSSAKRTASGVAMTDRTGWQWRARASQ
eukprot:6205625-Pleurochrysis_carterae.AAC.5